MQTPIVEAFSMSLLLSACICLTVIGNIFVILSVLFYRPLRSRVQNFYIVSLAFADLAVSVLVMPFNLVNSVMGGRWIFGTVFCNFWLTCDVLTCTASILHLCAIAIDRYKAIVSRPLEYAHGRTMRRVLVEIGIVWTASALISVPPLIGWNTNGSSSLYNERDETCQLTQQKGYVIYSACGSFFIPLLIMSFVYCKILAATRAQMKRRNKNKRISGCSVAVQTSSARDSPSNNLRLSTRCRSMQDIAQSTVYFRTAERRPRGAGTSVTCLLSVPSPPATRSYSIYLKPTDIVDRGLKEPCLTGSSTRSPKANRSPTGSLTGSTNDVSLTEEQRVFLFFEQNRQHQRLSLTKEQRVARTMVIIMGAFVLCWLPFFLMYVIIPFCGGCAGGIDRRLVNFITWLGYINSTINPIIYTVFNVDFRKAFKIILKGRCRLESGL